MGTPGMLVLASFVPGWDLYVGLITGGLNALARVTGSGGLAIILFTIFIKILLTPLTVKSIRSARAMQDLQPKIKAIQKRYGSDRQKVSAETMKLYQAHKVNPMAGCLPMLLQIPVFIGLYTGISDLARGAEGPFTQPFLWLTSLAKPDGMRILPFVAAFFQLIQTRMSLPTGKHKSTDPQQQMMTQMMQFMPITVIFFGWNFYSGLVLYWATQSIFGAIQQYYITGWGALREWLPFLPEVVRYTPPDPDDIDESKVIVTGSDEHGAAPAGGGLWGMISRQIEKVEQQRNAGAGSGTPVAAVATPEESTAPTAPRSRVVITRTAKSAGADANGTAPPERTARRPSASKNR